MATSRPFAYNTGSTISGTEQVGDLAIGVDQERYDEDWGSVKWWMGPDEDLGYVIAQSVPSGNQPNPVGIPAYVGFFRSATKTEQSFVNLTNTVYNQSFTTGDECKTYLNNNGYWTNWVSYVTNNLLVYLDATNTISYSGVGNTWYNLIGSTNNATLFNSPTYNSSNPKYLNFSKTSLEYGTIPNIGTIQNWTIEVWVRFTSSLTGQIASVVCNEFNLSSSLNFSIGTNRAPSSYNISAGFFQNGWYNTTGFAPVLNTWYQIVGTYDGTTIKQYVNGVASGGTTNVTTTLQSGGEVRIMRRWDSALSSGNLIDGDLSLVRIYNSALTDNEILQNFNADKSKYGL